MEMMVGEWWKGFNHACKFNMTQPIGGCREHEDTDALRTSNMTQVSQIIHTGAWFVSINPS